MKLEERKQNSFIQKSIFLLIIMTLWICLGTGFTVNAAQREDTKLLKIYDGKSIEASQIQFKAEVATPDSNRIDIYRSEKPVSQGGKLEKLDSFRVIGDFWEVLGDNLYMNYGDNFKVQCYSNDVYVEGNLTFVDTTTKAGHQYSYRLVYGDKVYDPDSGEYSVEVVSNIIDVKANLQTPELYKCYSTDNKTVNLSWSYIAQADGYRVYRYDNGKWSFLKNVKKRNVITTTDKNVQTGKTYQYRVLAYRVIKGKNIYSSKSKARKITLKTATVKGDYQYGSVYGPYLDAQHLAQVRSVVQSFKINYIRKGMSDYDRVLTAYNYLRSNCSYAYKGWQYNYANTAWGALVYGEAQCSGYARAMKALCDAIGVDCRYVHADSKASNPSHQWNQVRVGGKWYILDAQSGGFLLGSRTWKKKAGMSWDAKGLPTCSVTDYKKKS